MVSCSVLTALYFALPLSAPRVTQGRRVGRMLCIPDTQGISSAGQTKRTQSAACLPASLPACSSTFSPSKGNGWNRVGRGRRKYERCSRNPRGVFTVQFAGHIRGTPSSHVCSTGASMCACLVASPQPRPDPAPPCCPARRTPGRKLLADCRPQTPSGIARCPLLPASPSPSPSPSPSLSAYPLPQKPLPPPL